MDENLVLINLLFFKPKRIAEEGISVQFLKPTKFPLLDQSFRAHRSTGSRTGRSADRKFALDAPSPYSYVSSIHNLFKFVFGYVPVCGCQFARSSFNTHRNGSIEHMMPTCDVVFLWSASLKMN